MPTLRYATKLLLHANNDAWLDHTQYCHVVTANSVSFNTTDKKFGSAASQHGSRDGGYLGIPDSEGWNYEAGAFTFDCWFRSTDLNGDDHYIYYQGSAGVYSPFAVTRIGSNLYIYASSTGYSWDLASNLLIGTVSLNTWTHFAVCRDAGGPLETYLDTVLKNSIATGGAALFNCPGILNLGGVNGMTLGFGGQLDEIRIVKGLYLPPVTLPVAEYEGYDPEYYMRDPVSVSPMRTFGTSTRLVPLAITRSPVPSLISPWPYDLDGTLEPQLGLSPMLPEKPSNGGANFNVGLN